MPQKLSRAKIKKRKTALRKLKMSLRDIAKLYNNEVTFQTLGRFINEADYIPKDPKVCEVLGLYLDENPYRKLPRWYKRLPEALEFFNKKREQIKGMSESSRNSIKIHRN